MCLDQSKLWLLDPSGKYVVLILSDLINEMNLRKDLLRYYLEKADAFHSIWCEMGAPSVLITDKDLSGFINRHVKKNLISHGIRHLMSRSINCQVNSENDYIKSYLLAIRAFNCTAKGDPPAANDTINYDALSAGTYDSDNFGFARAMLPFVKEIQEEVSSSINEYIEYWYHKQAEYRKKINLSTETTYPDPKPFDLVFITNYSDIGPYILYDFGGPRAYLT
ncbi:hypothetical protein FOL47_003506 [Perkinsus chesapeaki]|uniref:Uncharacterized protein n=1 Tax=Perkinsus chesapeaki TaxID=330153 RepID=A0A7J6KMC0_PERCH|nr:hypothetical protein FOL47_003506 [Perkinsus chesapeaki]